MHLILTGATGLVGSAVLDAMVHTQSVTKISILSRRPVKMAAELNDPRIKVIIHKDFEHYDADVLRQLQGARGCVWALGISQNTVGKDEYVKITRDYAVEAAKAFAELGEAESPFRFVYVSGEGATQSPGRFSATFARVKGETEETLARMTEKLPGLRADSARPGYVDVREHAAIQPYVPDPGLLYKASAMTLGVAIRGAYKRIHSPTEMLGRFFTQMAMGEFDDGRIEGKGAFRLGSRSWVVENVGIRRLMGL